MTTYAPTFNGIDLSKYIRVTSDFERGIGVGRTNQTLQVGKSDFEKYQGYTLKKDVIPMPFKTKYNLISKRRELAQILNVSEPTKLIFPDEPDIYYLAVPEGNTGLTEQNFLGSGTINWLVPDGVAHAIQEKEYFADDSGIIKIDNKGTYKTYPILETTMQSDNGLVAFINSNGALLQFGNPDEVDSVGYQESDWVVNDRLFTQTEVEKAGWKVNDVTFPDKLMGKYTLTPNGTIEYKTAEGVPLATADGWGDSSEYHGVTLSRDISPDSQGYVGAKNFEVRFGLYFITGQLNQTGLALVELRDKNDKQVCSISFVKNASTNNVGIIRLNVRGNVFYEQKYETNMWNIYTNINTEFSIVKHGNEFNFHLGGIKNGGFIKTYRDDTQTNIEVTKIVWFGGIFGANSSPMENSIRSVTMQKHNVDKLRDIPNQFGKGDVLRVDPASGTVYINGLETYGWAIGNDYERFVLEPGENTIRCLVSSWVKQENMPQIKVINREAYL